MKRDIACPVCEVSYEDHPRDMDGPAEKVYKVFGTALNPFICDSCGARIPKGSRCVAISVVREDQQYSKWEEEFVEPVSAEEWRISKLVARKMTGKWTPPRKDKRNKQI